MATGIRTVISTGDKDMAQLVNDHVSLVNTMSNEVLDEAGVLAKFGVPPSRIIDYLSLIGDTVDNVPGVPKVGPKTAVKWLTEYDSLDNIIASADKIGGVVGKTCAIRCSGCRWRASWSPSNVMLALDVGPADLAPLPQDVPSWPSCSNALNSRPGCARFRALLFDYQCQRALPARLQRPSRAVCRAALISVQWPSGTYVTILTSAQLDEWLAKLDAAEIAAVDTETTSLDPLQAKIVGISFGVQPIRPAYLPLAHRAPGAPQQLDFDATLAKLKPWLENPGQAKLGQNLKYDQHVFANHGIALAGIAHDTCCSPMCWKATKPTIWTIWRSAAGRDHHQLRAGV